MVYTIFFYTWVKLKCGFGGLSGKICQVRGSWSLFGAFQGGWLWLFGHGGSNPQTPLYRSHCVPFEFICTINHWNIFFYSPTPSITWTWGYDINIEPRRIQTGPEGSELKIRDITFDDAGTYTCEAFNGVGQPIRYTTAVTVRGKYYIHEQQWKLFLSIQGIVRI